MTIHYSSTNTFLSVLLSCRIPDRIDLILWLLCDSLSFWIDLVPISYFQVYKMKSESAQCGRTVDIAYACNKLWRHFFSEQIADNLHEGWVRATHPHNDPHPFDIYIVYASILTLARTIELWIEDRSRLVMTRKSSSEILATLLTCCTVIFQTKRALIMFVLYYSMYNRIHIITAWHESINTSTEDKVSAYSASISACTPRYSLFAIKPCSDYGHNGRKLS